MAITGRCHCGAVRYTVTAEPIVTRLCWCRDCQYFAAGNATVNVCFPREAFFLEGELRDYACRADSGNLMHRGFCATCGTPMTSAAEIRPHLVFVRAGTLDDPSKVRPVANIWTRSAPVWAHFDERLSRFDGQPPPPSTPVPATKPAGESAS